MAFSVAPADIVKAIQIGTAIYRTWFLKGNRADTQYREFGNSIRGLVEGLDQLKGAFENDYHVRHGPDGDYHDPIDPALEQDRILLIGDFTATLNECSDLLKRKSSVNKDGLSFARNSVWHLTTGPVVDSLRNRIQFHMTKMLFITEPLKAGLLKDIARDTEIIRCKLEELHAVQVRGVSPNDLRLSPIPENLKKRFDDAFTSNAPVAFSDGSNRTIEPTFEALHQHFLQSTWSYQGPTYGMQTIEQYLNLIKAQYLLERLRNESELFTRYYYERSVTRIEQRIKTQFRRPDITRYNTEELDGLDTKSFEIWTSHEQPKLLGLENGVESGVPEEEILALSLALEDGMSRHDLIVFRQSQSNLEFNLVQRLVFTAATDPHRDREYPINMHHCRYIPWYANPKNRTPSTKVELRNSALQGGKLYTLKDQEDVRNFQHAMLGYRVVCDKTSFTWKFHSDKCGQNAQKSQNRIQLWRQKPFRAQKKESDQQKSDSDGASLGSPVQPVSTTATSVHSRRRSREQDDKTPHPTFTRSIITGYGSTTTEIVTAIRQPKPPVLLLFTMLGDSFTFIHIELDTKYHLSPASCSCLKTPQTCRSAVIKRTKGTNFKFKVHSVTEQNLDMWDLALFSFPRHPAFNKLESRETSYLSLDFATVDERKDFTIKFNKLITIYYEELEAANKFREEREYTCNHPRKPSSPSGTGSPSTASVFSTASSMNFEKPTSPGAPKLPAAQSSQSEQRVGKRWSILGASYA